MNYPLFAMFPPSGMDLMVISVLVLVLFGAKKLPIFARSMGRSLGEFRRAKEEFERELHSAVDESYSKEPEKRIESPKVAENTTIPVGSAKAD